MHLQQMFSFCIDWKFFTIIITYSRYNYIITFDTPNMDCSFHDIEQFLPDQHKKEKKK